MLAGAGPGWIRELLIKSAVQVPTGQAPGKKAF